MRNALMTLAVFLIGSFCLFGTQRASAQTNTCALRVNVSTTNKAFETRAVNGARAIALNTNNHKSISAVSELGTPTFRELRDGEYRITVTKLGFKRAIQPLSFTCEQMNAWTTLNVELTPGNFRRSVVARTESVNANNTNIPPVRRGVTTVLGSENANNNIPPVKKGVTTIIGSDNTSVPADDVVAREKAPPVFPTTISGGVLNGKAVSLPRPPYPPVARRAHASGTVVIQVVIDEAGNVISARAVSGHPLLQAAARQAALGARFHPTKLSGQPVKVTGVITYNFVAE